jgi:hypothetical protein
MTHFQNSKVKWRGQQPDLLGLGSALPLPLPRTTKILRTTLLPWNYVHTDRGHSTGVDPDAGVVGAACDKKAMRADVVALGRSSGVGMGARDDAGAGGKSKRKTSSRWKDSGRWRGEFCCEC